MKDFYMMLFNGRLKYLFLIPIVLMIVFTLFYQYALVDIQQQVLDGRMAENLMEIDLTLLTTGIMVETVITFLVDIIFVVLLCYLGTIYKSREGAKWRCGYER